MFTIATLGVIGTAVWLCIPAERPPQYKVLKARFDQLVGYDGEPGLQIFKETGPDAVLFLAHQMQRKDSFLNEWYVALWPLMPKDFKSALKQATKAADTRARAVGVLRQVGPILTATDVALGALTAALEHPDTAMGSIAAGALGDLGPRAKASVPSLIESIGGRTNINGVWALGRIGPEAVAALPILKSKMRQATGRERVYAAGAVWRIGGEDNEARSVVMKAMEDSDRHVRIDATNVLHECPEIGIR